jgi:hypothetical protein
MLNLNSHLLKEIFMKNIRQQRIEEVKKIVETAKKEKKVNRMVEIAMQSEAFRSSYSSPKEDRYLMSSQNPEGITKEDLEQLAEWARNQIPSNRIEEKDDNDGA